MDLLNEMQQNEFENGTDQVIRFEKDISEDAWLFTLSSRYNLNLHNTIGSPMFSGLHLHWTWGCIGKIIIINEWCSRPMNEVAISIVMEQSRNLVHS